MKFEPECKVLWHDRRRYFGKPISFTRYYLVEKEGEWMKFFSHEGLLSALIDEVNIYRCFDVQMKQTFWDRVFRTGTIIMKANDDSSPEIRIKHIKDPMKVRDLLSSLIEKERDNKKVGITEFR